MISDEELFGSCMAGNYSDAAWPYCPSFPAAVAVTVLFGVLTAAHLTQAFYFKARFCWVICMASSWETAGFALRILGSKHVTQTAFVVPSNILVLLAPLWINAFVYMTVGRMVYFWIPEKKIWMIKATSLTQFFVWADVFVFLVQAGGGSMIGSEDAPQAAAIGLDVYMGGIGLQQAILVGFFGFMVTFHRQALKNGKMRSTSWKPLLYALYSTLVLITVRIIFRLVEFSSGVDGPMAVKEHYFYILEAAPMVLAIAILAIFHPGRFLRGEGSEFPKPLVTKGHRRWWCCGRRTRSKTYPDSDKSEDASMEITML